MALRRYGLVRTVAPAPSGFTDVAGYLFALMLRNVASDGFVFTDPNDAARTSAPGCVIASPSYALDLPSVTQDYVYNWTRDAALVATEIAAASPPVAGGGSGPLEDYVRFAALCQAGAPGLGRACFLIDGSPRAWTDQYDGPALQTLAILAGFDQLDPATQAIARDLVGRNLEFLLARYRNPSYNLWEETFGQSFFTRSVQLRCLTAVAGATIGVTPPPGVDEAVTWLQQALAQHWNGEYYLSILDAVDPRERYDPNIDIVLAAVYGAVPCTDPRLLATAARIRAQWADPASPDAYPINAADASAGRGPLLGRYPGDVYDGDDDTTGTDHPWALCTAAFAQLYYDLAAAGPLPADPLAAPFLAQVGISAATPAADAVSALVAAGDAMLDAVVYHSDHLELSEQFDAVTGYEKSVRNLTWSYAAFLSAVRARRAAAGAADTAPSG